MQIYGNIKPSIYNSFKPRTNIQSIDNIFRYSLSTEITDKTPRESHGKLAHCRATFPERQILPFYSASLQLTFLSTDLPPLPHSTMAPTVSKDAQMSPLNLYSRFAFAGAVCCGVTHGAATPLDVCV